MTATKIFASYVTKNYYFKYEIKETITTDASVQENIVVLHLGHNFPTKR